MKTQQKNSSNIHSGGFLKYVFSSMLICVLSACSLNPKINHIPLDTNLNERLEWIELSNQHNNQQVFAQLQTTVFTPPGKGPFPLIIINHGKIGSVATSEHPRFRMTHVVQRLLQKGYVVVLPMRKDFSNSTGIYKWGACDLTENGYYQADDIAATIRHYQQKPYVNPNHIIVMGYSHGGLGSIALATQHLKGVKGIINLAGGLRLVNNHPSNHPCDWQNALIHAFANYGKKTNIPSLWLYGENDQIFPPTLTKKLYQAFTDANSNMHQQHQLILLKSYQKGGHSIFLYDNGLSLWWMYVDHFLQVIQDEIHASKKQ